MRFLSYQQQIDDVKIYRKLNIQEYHQFYSKILKLVAPTKYVVAYNEAKAARGNEIWTNIVISRSALFD